MEVSVKKRVIVYIDGFNLFFALREKNWPFFMWLDVTKLAQKLISTNQTLVEVKYFTSRITNNPGKQKRQNTYLDALGTLNNLQIIYGNYQTEFLSCPGCGVVKHIPGEKQTDVNIATEMLVDAFTDKADDLILITADSDQCPAMKAVRSAGKRVVIALPPGREKFMEVKFAADSSFDISAKHLRDALLPEEITLPSGFVIKCSDKWKP